MNSVRGREDLDDRGSNLWKGQENAVYRYKAIIGPEMRARTLARQRVEHRIGCEILNKMAALEILNKMAALGMPDTYCAG